MGWFTVNLNNEIIILASNQCKASRKAIWLLFSSSMVKEMCWSILLSVLWKESTAFLLMMQKLLSTYSFHTLGGTGVVLMAISSIASIHKLATTGLTGLPMVVPWAALSVPWLPIYVWMPTWVSFSELELLVRVISSTWNSRSLRQYDKIQIEKSFKFNAFSVV